MTEGSTPRSRQVPRPSLAEQIEAVALGLERGDRKPASAGRTLREIAEKVRVIEPCRDGWHKVPPYGYVPDEAQAPYIAGPVAEEGGER